MGKLKVVHLADVHLGVESYGRPDPATGLNSRLGDFTSTLDEAVDYAISEAVDLVIVAGDAYRSRDPNPTYQREFAKRIKRLSTAGVPVFLLAGNHDIPTAMGKANSVEIFETLGVDGVRVGRSPRLHTLETKSGPVQIVALPWLVKSVLFTKDELKNKRADELNQFIVDRVADFLQGAEGELDPAIPTIVVAHASIQGATCGSEKSIALGSDFVLPKGLFMSQAFDYVALGHIHKHQVLSNNPLMVYAGSVNRVDFGEEKEDKGFIVAEVERGSANYRFVPVNARRFLTIEVDADCEEPTERIIAAIERSQIEEAIVRLIINTSPERDAQISYHEVRRALKGAFNLAAISRQVSREHRLKFGDRLVEEMTPREALEMYLKGKQVPEERQKTLLSYADNVLAGTT